MPADFYDLLDVGSDASPEAIKRAYREKAREYHPDVNADERSSDQFKAVRTAYEVLSDASERADYDRMGHRAYVEQRLGGLPGANGATASGRSGSRSSSRSTQRRTQQSTAGSRRATSSARSSGRARSTAQESDSSGSRSTWGERTISEPGARARAMRAGERVGLGPALVVAAVLYLAGLVTFLMPHAALFDAFGTAILAGDVPALRSILLAEGFADPVAFVTWSIEQWYPGLLYPIGALAFPAALAVGAWQSGRVSWWLLTCLALGPVLGVAVGATAVPTSVGLDLALHVLAPAVAVVGTALLAISDR